MKDNKKSSLLRSLSIGLAVLAVFVIYAYGFEVTKVNLEELRSEQRQTSLVRVTRALSQPDFFEYEQESQIVNAMVYVTCPADGSIPQVETPETTEPYITVSPVCAKAGEIVIVEGYNFAPNAKGPVRFVPGSDPTNLVELGNDVGQTNAEGYFKVEVKLPNRPSDEAQFIRATIRKNVGAPKFTQTAKDTWNKIIETVFLALLATTLGTILAIPLSFMAARNLMKPVRSPLASISLSTLGWPLGFAMGVYLVKWVSNFATPYTTNIVINLLSVVLIPIILSYVVRWALPQDNLSSTTLQVRLIRLAVLLIGVLIGFFGLYQLSGLIMNLGSGMAKTLGSLAFLGRFFIQLGDILKVSIPVIAALAAGGVLSNLLGKIGQRASEKLNISTVRILNLVSAALAGAVIFGLLGWLVEWLYQLGRPELTFWTPVIVGAVAGLLLALFTKPKDTLPIGLVIYTITRTILNTLRSVEALVMAIVFVIAVGIGPFAGVMALGLHTIVSLAKLYSEQVESIMAGPLEAITATGANRLQTIIYAVVPQIIPPYISYTMYRWDINVRMSTIIGFVGGGGIGFLLQQNINLLNYRAASAQMIAIAVVVSLMDYLSSVMREKVV
ncbi:MAG: phosphonate ABC transporter inner membrane subunit [Chloroflexi bacterium OLB14]|nr:MAG: phosphonate ABC transporter inner membrane subunit [Chloroflexi bacterium OLB14]